MDEIEQLNQQIDLMLSSEDALKAALDGENPLLQFPAHLADVPPPRLSEASKARIQLRVESAKIASPNYLAWAGGLGAMAVLIVAVVSFSGLLSSASQNTPSIKLTVSGNEAESTENVLSDGVSTEEATSEIVEATSEAIDIVEPSETESPDTLAPSDEIGVSSTDDSNPVQVETSNVLLTNPGGKVNVRSGPSTSSEIIAALTPNTEVVMLGTNETGAWIQVGLEDGRQGWISASLLSEKEGTDGQPIAPGGSGRDTDVCEHGNSCNAPGQTGENQGKENARGQGNK